MYKIKTLNAISDIIHDYLPATSYEITTEGDDYHGILVRSAQCCDMAFPDSLLAISRAGAGVNNIPIDRCSESGICVFNTPGANANAVKELVLAAMLFASRNIPAAIDWINTLKGKGDKVAPLVEKGKSQFVGPEIRGKKLGVIGLGAIGVMVANDAKAIGMEVYGYDPFISVESAWHLSRGIHRSNSLDELLSTCDYITLHVPLMEKTRGYIGVEQLSKIKKGAYLLNFARGELVDLPAILEALETGVVAKYITDFPTDELIKHPNAIAIPHLGASTPESEETCAAMAASQLRSYIEHGDIINSVNLPDCCMPHSTGIRLTFVHRNAPNMVGQIAAVLAQHHANIDNMINKSKGNMAYTMIDLDEAVGNGLTMRLESIDGVIRVREIRT
ncbi:MAG: phosphoglycerate dehydrogenase [Christensenellales bacterium]|jgi:D-3-phosphoglycerate dehydrogenase